MVLVHLYYQNVQFGDFLGKLLGEYTRFAAGGFIFVSGLSIGVIFWPRVQDARRRASTNKSLWRRAIYILGVHILSGEVLICLPYIWGGMGNFTSPFGLLQDIFLLRGGGDLLPFYVMMIALSPLLMLILRKKWGWLGILIASPALFIWGLWHPWAFAIAQHDKFPPVLWQMIFILGLLLGWAWPKYNALTNARKTVLATISWLIAGALFIMEYNYLWGMPQLSFGTAFTKVPLSTPEAPPLSQHHHRHHHDNRCPLALHQRIICRRLRANPRPQEPSRLRRPPLARRSRGASPSPGRQWAHGRSSWQFSRSCSSGSSP